MEDMAATGDTAGAKKDRAASLPSASRTVGRRATGTSRDRARAGSEAGALSNVTQAIRMHRIAPPNGPG